MYKPKGRRIWHGRFRLDGNTVIEDVSLRTCDKQVAQQRLRDVICEKERAGILAPQIAAGRRRAQTL